MSDAIRQELMDAIGRIESGNVTSAELVARKRAGKPIKLNYTTVHYESGRARGLIGYDGCAYDDVRKIITAAMNPVASLGPDDVAQPTSKSMQKVVERLRKEKAQLKREKSQLGSELAAARQQITLMKEREARREHDASRTKPRANRSHEHPTSDYARPSRPFR